MFGNNNNQLWFNYTTASSQLTIELTIKLLTLISMEQHENTN